MRTLLCTFSIILASILFSTDELSAQAKEGSSFKVSGQVSVSTSTTGETTVQVQSRNEDGTWNDKITVTADSDSEEDIDKAKDKAGRELLDQLLDQKVVAGPDGEGDYKGGGSIPKGGPGDIPMPTGAPGDIVIKMSPIVVFGDNMPPLKKKYDGTEDLRKNFIMDFMAAVQTK